MARRLYATAELSGKDDESLPWEDDEYGSSEYTRESVLSGRQPQEVLEMEIRWGGECRAQLTLTGQIQANEDIGIEGNLRLYEGTSEGTTDRDGEETFTFLVPANGPGSKNVQVNNEDEGGDWVKANITAFNLPDMSSFS